MSLLLHICCGPCAAYPVKFLREQGYSLSGYFYNPNIHPYKEFQKRLETLQDYVKQVELELIVDDQYCLEEFLLQALHSEQGRCHNCYEMRLRQTAKYAKAHGFEAFSSTLLVSPYQKHQLIIDVAEQVARQEEIPFAYFDFRSGWYEGVAISKQMELYRQPYCGCIFSEKERYLKPKKEK